MSIVMECLDPYLCVWMVGLGSFYHISFSVMLGLYILVAELYSKLLGTPT